VNKLVLDPAQSAVRIQTFAEGMLARLAHDVELACEGLAGHVEAAASGWVAQVRAPVDRIVVRGFLKNGRLETDVKESDRRDIVDKMRKEVFHRSSAADAVEVAVEIADVSPGDERALKVRIVVPRGRAVERTIRARIPTEGRIEGSLRLSLSEVGSDPVKGPMNAFRVKDEVVVRFDLLFAPARADDSPQPA
jgi:hypothetical protein